MVVLVRAVRELWNVRVVSKVYIKRYINDLLDIFEVLCIRTSPICTNGTCNL